MAALLPGRQGLGLSSRETLHLRDADKTTVAQAKDQLAFDNANRHRARNTITVPANLSDKTIERLQLEYQHVDFQRRFRKQPHAVAAAARNASIFRIIDDLAQLSRPVNEREPPVTMTLIGPSAAQVDRFHRNFPGTVIHVFQPVQDARDIARWAGFAHLISHPVPWSASTAVPSEVVVSLLSVGAFHPSDFFSAALVAMATQAFVLHHWSPESLISDYTDEHCEMTFSRSGDEIRCTLPGSSAYSDSARATADWLYGEHAAHRGSITSDQLHQFGSLRLLHFKIGRGAPSVFKSDYHQLDQEYALLPALDRFPARLVGKAPFDRVLDYLSRQPVDTLTPILARNRLSALSHRVAIGGAVLQEAVHVPEEAAEHLAEVTYRIAKLRSATLYESRANLEKAIAESATDSIVLRNLRNLDGKLGLAAASAEIAARLTVKSWCLPARLAYNATTLVTGATPLDSPVAFTPISGRAARSSMANSYRFCQSTAQRDLDALTVKPSSALLGRTSYSSDRYQLSKVSFKTNSLDLLCRTAAFHAAIVYHMLPARSLNLRARLVQLAQRLPQAARDNLLHYLRQWLNWSLAQAVLDFFTIPNPIAAAGVQAPLIPSMSGSSTSSSSDGDDDEPPPDRSRPPSAQSFVDPDEPDAPADDPTDHEADDAQPSRPPTPAPEPAQAAPLDDEPVVPPEQGIHAEPLAEAQPEAFRLDRQLQLHGDLSSLTFQVGDIMPRFSAPTQATQMDREATIAPFEHIGRGMPTESFAHRPSRNVDHLGSAGPHSLYRTIAHALLFSHNSRGPLHRDAIRRVLTAKKDVFRRPSHNARSNHGTDERDQNRNQQVREAIERNTRHVKLLDVSVNGLPASAKSTLLLDMLNDDDLVVVPTNELRDAWVAKLGRKRTKVRTFDTALRSFRPEDFRMVVIDELYIFEAHYVAALSALGRVSVGVGEDRQISAFHLRNSQADHPFVPSLSRFHVTANFSLGLPAPVLALGISLGIVPHGAITANSTGRLSLYVDEDLAPLAPPENLNIVFNRAELLPGWITAHESQGSRAKEAIVRVTDNELHFLPRTGHFWTAISRATEHTHLSVSAAALVSIMNELTFVDGHDTYKLLSVILAIGATIPQDAISLSALGQATSIVSARDAATDACQTYEFERAYHVSHGEYCLPQVYPVVPEQVDAALERINDNFENIQYPDVVDLVEMELPRDPTVAAKFRLDLQASPARTSSTLKPAGVPFSSADTKTELYTIGVRYLCNDKYHDPTPYDTASELTRSFISAYVDPAKTSFIPIDRASTLNAWLSSRSPGTFRPSMEEFLETRFSTSFNSFLKAHAKAKNSSGFGLTIEKGQTIAAGSQGYNSRFTHLCRSFTAALQQVLCDDFVLDVGFSDDDFSGRCELLQLYDPINTQIDLSSQDSTHRESHVLSLLQLMAMFTDATADELAFYYRMRAKFTVRAKSFDSDNSIEYDQNWTLPSGDPLTLLANCIQETSSTAYVFQLNQLTRPPGYAKGDDQYYKGLLLPTAETEVRRAHLGVVFKIDHCLPPFAAGRFITPDNRAYHDPVKHVAKFSVKNLHPAKYWEYAQAYSILMPAVPDYTRAYLELAAIAHHPSLAAHDVAVIFDFGYSLWNVDFLRSFQRPDARAPWTIIDAPTDCLRIACRVAGYPEPPARSKALDVVARFSSSGVPFVFRPFAVRAELRSAALAHPLSIVFSLSHAVVFCPQSR